MSLIIGVDPDSKRYGVAIYRDAKLVELHACTLIEFSKICLKYGTEPLYVIEDVKKNSFMYARNVDGKNRAIQARVAQSVGMCKQAQTNAEDFISEVGAKLIRVKPQKGNWAKDKPMFERITGWKSRSNEDTRSAAFFGFLHLKKTREFHDRAHG